MDEARASVHAKCSPHVLWPLLHASMVMSFCYVLDFIKLALQGHGRGKSLGTYLVLQLRVSGVVSLKHVSMFQYVGCAKA